MTGECFGILASGHMSAGGDRMSLWTARLTTRQWQIRTVAWTIAQMVARTSDSDYFRFQFALNNIHGITITVELFLVLLSTTRLYGYVVLGGEHASSYITSRRYIVYCTYMMH